MILGVFNLYLIGSGEFLYKIDTQFAQMIITIKIKILIYQAASVKTTTNKLQLSYNTIIQDINKNI